MIVEVNHVMDKDHYIEWISMVYQNKEEIYYLNPNNETRVEFDYKKGATIYSYCNKHGLWKNTVD